MSYEASIVLSGLTLIVSRLNQRCLLYAAKHPNHYKNNLCFPSHVDSVKNLAQKLNIDLSQYQRPIKTPSCISPNDRIPILSSMKGVDFYPLRQNGCINIYTDGSKSSLGTGCAFVMLPPTPLPLKQEQFKMKPENTVY